MPSKQTTCIYCGQAVSLTYEQGRPRPLQNGRPHKCSFSKLGLSGDTPSLSRQSASSLRSGRKANRTSKWAFWAGLFG